VGGDGILNMTCFKIGFLLPFPYYLWDSFDKHGVEGAVLYSVIMFFVFTGVMYLAEKYNKWVRK
jgi:hypothetical protein